MLREVYAQQLLLPGQLLLLGRLWCRLQLQPPQGSLPLRPRQVEQRGLPRLPLLLRPLRVGDQPVQAGQQRLPLGQLVERPSLDQALQRPLGQVAGVHPLEELLHAGEGPVPPCLDDPLRHPLAHVLHVGQPEADRPRPLRLALQPEVDAAPVHVRG